MYSAAIWVEEERSSGGAKCRGDFEVQEVCMKAQGKPQSQQHRAQGHGGGAWSDAPRVSMSGTLPRRDYLP